MTETLCYFCKQAPATECWDGMVDLCRECYLRALELDGMDSEEA